MTYFMSTFIKLSPSDQKNELENIVQTALAELYQRDAYLIVHTPNDVRSEAREAHVCERATVFRLGHYIDSLMRQNDYLQKYDLDCEYNRDEYNQKCLPDFPNGVYPDLIIHKRGSNEYNILVIEVKTWWNPNVVRDLDKLRGLVSSEHYRYRFGLSLTLEKNKPKLVWIDPRGD